MVDLTPEQRNLTGAIVERVHEVDWNGDITPYIDSIVSVIDELVAQDPKFREFAQVIRGQAARWSMAAWADDPGAKISDSGWSQLADRLEPYC